MRRSFRRLAREGFRHVFVFRTEEEFEAATIERQPLWNNKCNEHGPFDIIGDVHGCHDELIELLSALGYEARNGNLGWIHPAGRKAIFVGDLVDRGPKIAAVCRLVMQTVRGGNAFCVPGNHEGN